jgi:succinyl-diaminopimelate desuccinylase
VVRRLAPPWRARLGARRHGYHEPVRESSLAERLIAYDTSSLEGMRAAAEFVKGWLESRDVEVSDTMHNGRPLLAATVGAEEGPTVVLHGHVDVVPAPPEQFRPRVEGDRLVGRGAYDMKGALAAMMCATRDLAEQQGVRVHLLCVSDEESDESGERGSDALVERGYHGDFAITGEPTELRIGVQAKGVLGVRLEVTGKAAHGSTPWLGDNAVVKALDVYEQVRAMPFARESSELFDRPSINLGRIAGGDALNKVPDRCVVDVDIRYLPGQDPGEIFEAIDSLPGVSASELIHRDPVTVDARNPYVRTLAEVVARGMSADRMSVGRDGASDAVSFLEAGVPAVEFGPEGGGHHGPDEWVSISSLERYRTALVEFVRLVPERLGRTRLHVA